MKEKQGRATTMSYRMPGFTLFGPCKILCNEFTFVNSPT